jgi:hypothetical protein
MTNTRRPGRQVAIREIFAQYNALISKLPANIALANRYTPTAHCRLANINVGGG